MAVGDAHVFPGFLTPVLTQLSLKFTDYFSHMLQNREAKILRKESLPEPDIELTTTWLCFTVLRFPDCANIIERGLQFALRFNHK